MSHQTMGKHGRGVKPTQTEITLLKDQRVLPTMGRSAKGINMKAAKRVIIASQAWRKRGENRQITKGSQGTESILYDKIRVNV